MSKGRSPGTHQSAAPRWSLGRGNEELTLICGLVLAVFLDKIILKNKKTTMKKKQNSFKQYKNQPVKNSTNKISKHPFKCN